MKITFLNVMRKAEPPVLDMFAAVGNDSVFHLIHWHSYIYSTFPDVKSTQENSCYPTPKTKVIPQLIKYGCEEKCTKMVVNAQSYLHRYVHLVWFKLAKQKQCSTFILWEKQLSKANLFNLFCSNHITMYFFVTNYVFFSCEFVMSYLNVYIYLTSL